MRELENDRSTQTSFSNLNILSYRLRSVSVYYEQPNTQRALKIYANLCVYFSSIIIVVIVVVLCAFLHFFECSFPWKKR